MYCQYPVVSSCSQCPFCSGGVACKWSCVYTGSVSGVVLCGDVVFVGAPSCVAEEAASLVVGGVVGAGGGSSLSLASGQYGHGSESAGR